MRGLQTTITMYQLGTASLGKDLHDEAVSNFREAIRITSANKYPDTGLIGPRWIYGTRS